MKVKIICPTYYNFKRLFNGDIAEVDESTAERWIAYKIAVKAAGRPKKEGAS